MSILVSEETGASLLLLSLSLETEAELTPWLVSLETEM